MWGEVEVASIERAYVETLETALKSQSLGIGTTFYVHEATKDNDSQVVLTNLFRRFNLAFDRRAVDWTNGPVFGEEGSNIVFYDNPPDKFINGVKKAEGYGFNNSGTQLDFRFGQDLAKTKVFDIYNFFMSSCEKDLGISIK